MKVETKAILNFAKKMKDWPPDARKEAAKAVKEKRESARAHYLLSGDERTADDILKETMGEDYVE